MTRIMVTWGLISAGMMFVHSATSFYWLRFLLGVAEAGFFPGIVLYLTYWIPSKQRSAVMAAFLTATAVSGIIGNPLAGVLMKMDGIGNLRGWQWLFLLEGIRAGAAGRGDADVASRSAGQGKMALQRGSPMARTRARPRAAIIPSITCSNLPTRSATRRLWSRSA